MVEICLGFVEAIGEEGIYQFYLENHTSKKSLESKLCFGKGVLGECTIKKKKDPPKESHLHSEL